MTNAIEPLPVPAHEELREVGAGSYAKLLARLSGLSVTHHFDAYGDIAWYSPQFAIDPADPRWELTGDDPLGATAWYRALPAETRARLGLDFIASTMKLGLEFERVLKRFIVGLGRRFPALFFVFVLGGEEPIDYVQRKELRSGEALHPLLERVMRIHVTEEARHLSFARHYLRAQARSLSRVQRLRLGVGAPVILSVMASMMLRPSAQLVKQYRIPRSVIREAYTRNPAHHAESLASMRRVRKLCDDMGLLTPGYRRIWRLLRLTENGIPAI